MDSSSAGRVRDDRLDFSSAELRRRVRQIQVEHITGLAPLREGLARLVGLGDAGSAPAQTDLEGNALSRRRFIGTGGLALLSCAAVACTPSRSKKAGGGPPTPATVPSTSTTVPVDPDVIILRLASSLEHAVIAVYQRAAGLDLLKNQALLDATTYFSTQHADHAGLFQSLTAQKGGQVFADPNQAILDSLQDRIAAVATEADVIKLAYDVESIAAATYFSVVGTFKDSRLNAATMSVGAVESRHVAVLGLVLSGLPKATPGIAVRTDSSPYPAQGFQTLDGAVSPGTGV